MADEVRVKIYTTPWCGYCTHAISLLHAKGVPFEEIGVDQDPAKRRWLVQATGLKTVPQIFIDDISIGGYDDLAAMNASGELKERFNL